MSNPYHKFQEAAKVFLNPSLDLIRNDESLEEHCYFLIHKYPKADDPVWELVDQIINKNNLDTTSFKTIKDKNLKRNLELAQKNDDYDYLTYIISFRPNKTKKSLTFVKKKSILPDHLAKHFHKQESDHVDRVQLKLLIHQYIQEHKLQRENRFQLDDVLREVLDIPSNTQNTQDTIHYFEFLKIYQAKYHASEKLKL